MISEKEYQNIVEIVEKDRPELMSHYYRIKDMPLKDFSQKIGKAYAFPESMHNNTVGSYLREHCIYNFTLANSLESFVATNLLEHFAQNATFEDTEVIKEMDKVYIKCDSRYKIAKLYEKYDLNVETISKHPYTQGLNIIFDYLMKHQNNIEEFLLEFLNTIKKIERTVPYRETNLEQAINAEGNLIIYKFKKTKSGKNWNQYDRAESILQRGEVNLTEFYTNNYQIEGDCEEFIYIIKGRTSYCSYIPASQFQPYLDRFNG